MATSKSHQHFAMVMARNRVDALRNQTYISTTPTPWTCWIVHVKLHKDTVLAVVPAWLAWTCEVGEVGDCRVNGAVAGIRRATGDYFAAYEKLGLSKD